MRRKLCRKRAAAAAAAVLAALALYACWICLRGVQPLTTGDTRMRMRPQADFVTAQGQLTAQGSLDIEQTFYLTNRTDTAFEEIVLRLYANGYGQCAVLPETVSVNGDGFDAALDEEDATLLRIARPWGAGEEIELTLAFSATAALSSRPTVIALPVLAPAADGQWHSGTWDTLAGTLYAPAMDGWLDLVYSGTLTAAFAGEAGHLGAAAGSQDGLRSAVIHADGSRGMVFAVAAAGCVRWREIGGVAVSVLAEHALQAERLLDGAKTALESLAAAGFAYPFAALTIVNAQSAGMDGDAYSGMIVLDAEGDEETLLRRMTRLIARQTFGVLAGCDAWNEPWLSQTLASTAELLAYRQRKGEAAFETRFFEEIEVSTRLTRPYGVNVGAGIERFGGDAEMTQVLRDQGAAMMLGIGQAIGYDRLAQALCEYAVNCAQDFGSRAALEAALERAGGGSWTGYLTDELAY